MKPFSILFIVFLVFINACKKNSTGIENQLPPADNQLSHFQVTQFAYDSLQVCNNSDLLVASKSIKSIQVGYASNNTFFIAGELPAEYESKGDHYLLKFDLRIAVDKHVIYYPLKIRFIFTDCSFTDFDSTVNMLKYPYPNCAVFMDWDEFLLPPYGTSVQDFDLDDSLFFFHPYGCAGLYKYDMRTAKTYELSNYCGGDFISYDYPFVFLDEGHHYIYRYDLQADTANEIIRVGAYDLNNEILGVAAAGDKLYLMANYSYPELYSYDYEGNSLDTLSLTQGYHISISALEYYNEQLFSVRNWSVISRYDLSTHKFLTDKQAPTEDTESVKIWREYLYFSDYDKQIIGRVPLEDVLNAPDLTKLPPGGKRTRRDE